MKLSILTIYLVSLLQPVQSNFLSLGGGHPWEEKPWTIQLSDPDPDSEDEDEDDMSMSYADAKVLCDDQIHCAGVSKYYTDDEETEILFHSFLPKLPATTYHSKKSFTLHRGAIRQGDLLQVGTRNMTVDEAQKFCAEHIDCVAFFYPIYSYKMNLHAPDSITFYSSVQEVDYELSDIWYTMLSNDLEKAKHINEDTLQFVQDMISFPYSSCCDRTEIPTLSDIKQVDTLERISCNITREDFITNYEMTRKPVMLVGCNENWKAQQKWTIDELVTRFDNSSEWTVDFGNGDEQEEATWQEISEAMITKKHFYIFNQADLPHQKVIEEDYDVPSPMQGNDLYERSLKSKQRPFPDKEYGSLRWWEVSNGNSGTSPFMDVLSTDSWTTVISGYKWWVLYPDSVKDEEQVECNVIPATCSNRNPTHSNHHASIAINAARMPFSNEDEKAMHILQRPGETIYIPYGHVHSYYNLQDTNMIGVTQNYGSVGNLCRTWGELVTSGDSQHWKYVYYNILNKRQREIVRSTIFWPPEAFIDWVVEDDIVQGPLSAPDHIYDEIPHHCPKYNY